MNRRAIVVEDERLPRLELCEMLRARGVTVVGEASTVGEAIRAIAKHDPDLVFLDVQLGKETGFDLLDRVDVSFDLIFVTAYDQYAVRAFEHHAIDYLLKPLEEARLDASLERLDDRSGPAVASGLPNSAAEGDRLNADDRLFVRDDRRWRFLRVGDVKVIEADGDYSVLRLKDGEAVTMPTAMREWEARLPAPGFVRIHRSTIVNLEFVRTVDEWFNRTYQVHVHGIERPYTMSRRYATRLKR